MVKPFTSEQFNALGELIRQIFKEETVDFVKKEDINHLPTKDEFYEETGRIYKKLQDLEEEKDILAHRIFEHEDRLSEVEHRLKISSR